MIYLDHNATTNLHPKIIENFLKISGGVPLNASSIHLPGQKAKSILERARNSVASLLGFLEQKRQYQVTFTSSGTESNNLIINNFRDDKIFISSTEHLSIQAHQKYLPNLSIIRVKQNGILDLEDLEEKLSKVKTGRKLVSVMLANNETGIIQPLKQITKLAHKYGALIHSDIVQAIGKIPVNIVELGIDFATISAHKFGGMVGAAALINKSAIKLQPMIFGGGQEKSLRPGTENIYAINSLGVAADLVGAELPERERYLKNLQMQLEEQLINEGGVEIVGSTVSRLPNTSLIINQGKSAKTQLIMFDQNNIAVSTGSACSSGKVTPSHILVAMGYLPDKINSAIRISCGMSNSPSDIDKFIEIYNQINK